VLLVHREAVHLRAPDFRQTGSCRLFKPSPQGITLFVAPAARKLNPDRSSYSPKLNERCPEIPVLYDLAQGFRRAEVPSCGNRVVSGIRKVTTNLAIVLARSSTSNRRAEVRGFS
jgi:hypothetical protein